MSAETIPAVSQPELEQPNRPPLQSGDHLSRAEFERRYQPLAADASGVLRSEVFPGLWLQPAALWASDLPKLLAVLQEGLAAPEHAAFLERLRAHQARPD
jgi:hypothetical protein